jgi:hypothetical protein
MNTCLQKLHAAIDAHDLDAIEACFAPDYRNETPVHPARGFVGAAQVRANWSMILGGLPDLKATLVRSAESGNEVWAEWELAGTRRDGVPQVLRGITVLGVEEDVAHWARFYLEPVDVDATPVDAHIARTLA